MNERGTSAVLGTRRRVLVLGGTGYIGRHVCAAFAEAGYRVAVVARRARPLPHGSRLRNLDLSLAGVADLARLFAQERPDVVVNATGMVWGMDEQAMLETNVRLLERIVHALGSLQTSPRLVQFGSTREYAPTEPGISLSEDAPLGPIDAYGRSKLAATRTVLTACAEGVIRGVVLRVGNVAGPGAPAGSLLGSVAEQLLAAAGQPAKVELHPLRARRDYIDVRDVARAAFLAAQSPVTGEVFNLGSGRAVPVRALVDLLVEVSGTRAQIIERAPDGSRTPTRTDITWQQTDARRADTVLGWRPLGSLRDALRDLWTDAAARWEHNTPAQQTGG
ncbi:NAD-dependent epimerase/dehydratase family protein [Streptomyces sp. NPDC059169]|uniref:NAD-dependent epimerase/dehydratase family protein n=1 Tax=Streptomyces sp. NPDC059169 TaxID=3346754 RepID=UPI0036AB8DA9